jgi:hypothetical protein
MSESKHIYKRSAYERVHKYGQGFVIGGKNNIC